MKALPYAIIAALALFVVVRRARSRGLDRPQAVTSPERAGGRWAIRGEAGLIAMREIRERLRGKVFKVVTALLLVVVGAAIIIPTVQSPRSPTMKIGVVGSLPEASREAVRSVSSAAGVRPAIVSERTVAAARAALRAHRISIAIVRGSSLLAESRTLSGLGTAQARAVRAIASNLGLARALDAADLTPAQAHTVVTASPLPIRGILATGEHGGVTATSLIGIILIFIMLSQYCTWTLMGVMEEKASRVVEVLLATVSPGTLLGGKLLGIGSVALFQGGLVVGFALIVAKATGSDLLGGSAPLVIAASLVWLVLGYAFYSWVYAAAGSMVERQDQVQSLALPLSVPMIVGYIAALIGASSVGGPSLLVTILAYVPPTAPFAMPLLVAKSAVHWWGFAIAVAISLVCTAGVARLAAAVYRRAVLRTGRRIRVPELFALGHRRP